MKTSKLCFVALGIFTVTAGFALLGCGIRQTLAQDRPRPGVLGRLRSDAEPQPDAKGATGSVSTERLEIAGLKVSVWRPVTTASTRPAPLVIFSHGFHGSSTQSKFLMKALAEAGYLVVAPNHKDAGLGGGKGLQAETGFGNPGAWSEQTYKDRADDIEALLKTMKQDPAWSEKVDWSKVALAGHSLGGYTVLGLAGGWPSWTMPEVKAVLALSPYCLPLAQKGTLSTMKLPVMYQGGTLDLGITPSVVRAGGAYDKTGGPTYLVEFTGAGHLAWTDLNPKYQASIAAYSIAFLDKYLRGKASADLTQRRQDVADLRSK